ncbi:MAG: M20/M25/M40 family metallo-hydrolase [Nannocystaceae bacterium]
MPLPRRWRRCSGLSLAIALVACRGQPADAPESTAVPDDPPPASEPEETPEPAPDPAAEAGPALPPAWAEAAAKIEAAARGDTTAWTRLAELVDTFGHRLSGSKALEGAIDWSIEVMRRDGLAEVRREKVMVPHWVRGEERAQIVGTTPRPLRILGLGGTVGTGKRPIRGPVVAVSSLEEVRAKGEALRGAIVVINKVMPPFDAERQETHYGATVPIRSSGASEAARHGAKAVLIRSVTAHSLASPHTGALRYADDAPKIPAAALAVEDADRLTRMAARGPVEVELFLGARTLPDAPSANAIGELRGRELPDEIVVIGGHIDSWDVGDGASDDGAGCMMAIEAVRLLQVAGLRPRRTIRVVLFTNEENGLRGGRAYHEAHRGERHVAAIESDFGAGAPRGFTVAGTEAQIAELQALAPLFRGIGADHIDPGGSGADIGPLTTDGVLGLGLHPDGSRYFDLHHSEADTLDKIDPDHLERNAAAMALMAYLLAER